MEKFANLFFNLKSGLNTVWLKYIALKDPLIQSLSKLRLVLVAEVGGRKRTLHCILQLSNNLWSYKTPNTLQQRKASAKPVKKRVTLTFPKRAVQMPVTYVLAKEFNVAANIIRAQVAPNQIGKLVLELAGDIDQLDAAIEWMRSRHVNVSYTLGEIAIDPDVCVHCGLCTGVCPTEALSLHPETYKLTFTRSRCIVCEQCIPSCPVQAISTNL